MWIALADHYLLFDFPGQVELFTLHSNAKNVILEMANKWDFRVPFSSCTLWEVSLLDLCESYPGHGRASSICRFLLALFDPVIVSSHILPSIFRLQLTAVHLVDAHLCSDPGKYVSALLVSLSTMLHLELPHINVFSKIDLIESYGKLGNPTAQLIAAWFWKTKNIFNQPNLSICCYFTIY